jgi:asparaginyl-tRNA synthetase
MKLLEKLRKRIRNNFSKSFLYTEAIEILKILLQIKRKNSNTSLKNGVQIYNREHERYLVEKHFKSPVILFDYPAKIKAFYMRLNDNTDQEKLFEQWMSYSLELEKLLEVHKEKNDLRCISQKMKDLGR